MDSSDPGDLSVFFHPSCAPRIKLPEKTQNEIGKLLAEVIVASYERTIARWARVGQPSPGEGDPPRFRAQVASIQTRRLFTMTRDEWKRVRAHEGRLIELDIERTLADGVASAASAIARLAAECSVHTERIEVWRYSETARPRPENLEDYLVLENFARRLNLPMFLERTSTQDSPSLRKHLRDHVFLVKERPDQGRWEPKTRVHERIVFLKA